MATTTQTTSTTAENGVAECKAIWQRLIPPTHSHDFCIRFWDGSQWQAEEEQPRFTIVLQHAGAMRKMFWPPNDLSVGEAFLFDDFDVEGDMTACVGFLRSLAEHQHSMGERLLLGWKLWRLPSEERPREGRQAIRLTGRRDSRQRAKQAIAYHYDVSNEFFALWLDPHLVYTCAYYYTPDDTIEQAQFQKHDNVCRKLRLQPGQRLLDIGCGWGGMITHAAEHFGVESVGVTLSEQQAKFGQARILSEGLTDRCRLDFADYRDFAESEQYDAISTLEVLEHWDASMLPEYFEKMHRLLRPGGSLLIQAITTTGPLGMVKWRKFNQHYVFPDGQLRPISEIQRQGENVGLEVRDVEGRREHYAMTLRQWLTALEDRHDEALAHVDEATYRAFRMYLAGAWLGYTTGTYNLHQVLFVKPEQGKSGYPLRRADWYE